MAEPGQKAWEAFHKAQGAEMHELSEWGLRRPAFKALWAHVELTIANEALRRAAEVAQGDFTDEPHFQPYASGRRDAADAILDLIKEPGHE